MTRGAKVWPWRVESWQTWQRVVWRFSEARFEWDLSRGKLGTTLAYEKLKKAGGWR